MPKTPAQKIRDYLFKKYGSSKDFFIKRKASDDVHMSDVQGTDKKKISFCGRVGLQVMN